MKVSVLGVSISLLGIALILTTHTGRPGLIVAFLGVLLSLFACFGKNVP